MGLRKKNSRNINVILYQLSIKYDVGVFRINDGPAILGDVEIISGSAIIAGTWQHGLLFAFAA